MKIIMSIYNLIIEFFVLCLNNLTSVYSIIKIKLILIYRYSKIIKKKITSLFKFKFYKLIYIKNELYFLHYKIQYDVYKYNYLILKYKLITDLYITYSNCYRNWLNPFNTNLKQFKLGIQESSILSYSFLTDALLYFWCYYYGELYFYYWINLLLFKYLFAILLNLKRGKSTKSVFCLHTFFLLSNLITYSLYICVTVWNPYSFIIKAFFLNTVNRI